MQQFPFGVFCFICPYALGFLSLNNPCLGYLVSIDKVFYLVHTLVNKTIICN
jgi:hypothetical protein